MSSPTAGTEGTASSHASSAGSTHSNGSDPSPTAPGVLSIANSSAIINATGTAQPSTNNNDSPGVPGGVIALLLGLLVLGIGVFCVIIYLRKTGKLYKMIPFKRLTRERRSSTSSSRRPLDVDGQEAAEEDPNHMDDMPQPREGSMFTIDDFETEPADVDSQSRGTNDEYFYDEVFGKSMFEDEVTNASMRQLYLASEQEDDEMFDVDAIVSSITTKATKT